MGFLALCQNEKTYYLNQIYQQSIFQIIEISKKEEKDYPNLPSLGFLYNQEIFNFYLDLLECDDEFIYMGREEPFLQFDHKDLKNHIIMICLAKIYLLSIIIIHI